MYPDPFVLKVGAILVADAHCAPWRTPFIDFLHAVESGEIATPQLILMGDVFDLLFGDIDATLSLNHDSVALLNAVAAKTEVLYLEGNHDFRLKPLFPNLRVIPRKDQPFIARFNDHPVGLSHGDTQMGFGYEVYTALIRNGIILKVLNRLDGWGDNFIVKRLIEMMKRKHHCKPISEFETLIRKRMSEAERPRMDTLIEGHFHQNCSFELPELHYINLGAFACNERYYSVQSSHNRMVLEEVFLSKESR